MIASKKVTINGVKYKASISINAEYKLNHNKRQVVYNVEFIRRSRLITLLYYENRSYLEFVRVDIGDQEDEDYKRIIEKAVEQLMPKLDKERQEKENDMSKTKKLKDWDGVINTHIKEEKVASRHKQD